MITLIPVTLSGTTPALYAVEINETLCGGYNTSNLPTVAYTVTNNGSVVASGGTTCQKLTFLVTITYQPCQNSSAVRTKTFAETATVAMPGTVTTVTPSLSSVTPTVTATKTSCCNRANGVKIQSSLSVAYS